MTARYSLLFSLAQQKNVVYVIKYRKKCSPEGMFSLSRAHVPLPNSASNLKFGFALDVGSKVEIGLFSRGCEI